MRLSLQASLLLQQWAQRQAQESLQAVLQLCLLSITPLSTSAENS